MVAGWWGGNRCVTRDGVRGPGLWGVQGRVPRGQGLRPSPWTGLAGGEVGRPGSSSGHSQWGRSLHLTPPRHQGCKTFDGFAGDDGAGDRGYVLPSAFAGVPLGQDPLGRTGPLQGLLPVYLRPCSGGMAVRVVGRIESPRRQGVEGLPRVPGPPSPPSLDPGGVCVWTSREGDVCGP